MKTTGRMISMTGMAFVALAIVCSVALAQMPKTISYQGTLATGSTLVPDGNYNVTFRLYAAVSGGSAVWTEAQLVATKNGVFNATLGKISPLPVSFNTPYWMSLQVGADAEMAPRLEMTGVAYSLQSASADSAAKIADNAVTSAKILDRTITNSDIALGTITNAEIAASAAIAASKISGDVGIEYAYLGAASPTTSISSMGSITITCPTGGYILAFVTGSAIFFGDATCLFVGLSTSNTTLGTNYAYFGRLDGTATLRYRNLITHMEVIPVSAAGAVTVYATVQTTPSFHTNTVTVDGILLACVFIGKHY